MLDDLWVPTGAEQGGDHGLHARRHGRRQLLAPGDGLCIQPGQEIGQAFAGDRLRGPGSSADLLPDGGVVGARDLTPEELFHHPGPILFAAPDVLRQRRSVRHEGVVTDRSQVGSPVGDVVEQHRRGEQVIVAISRSPMVRATSQQTGPGAAIFSNAAVRQRESSFRARGQGKPTAPHCDQRAPIHCDR
jgi:hypothetical protein